MDALSLLEICQVIQGRWLTPPLDLSIAAIGTDTRHLERGSLFFAVKGETFDAHDFLPQAAAAGAAAAIVHRPVDAENLPLIQVDDTRKAMGRLAWHVRRKLSGKVIAVAGSNGKTSTKFLIGAALEAGLRGSISPKSYNNDIGVPLAIFPARPDQDYLVLELGTNKIGEIRTLTHMAEPNAAVLTNASAEHLEFLGDVAGVCRENASIIEGLAADGLLVINGDDPELVEAACDFRGRWTSFGFGAHNNLFAADVRTGADGVRFKLNAQREVFVPLLGRHTAANALAAIAVGRWMKLSDDVILRGLAVARGPAMRLQLDHSGPVTLLDDTYNANPASMMAALETLRTLPATGRRIAVVGDMRELGPAGPGFHEDVGKFVAKCDLDQLVCVGPQARLIADVARKLGMAQERIALFPDAAAAAKGVPKALAAGDVILVKGSRVMGLEVVADAIRKSF